MPIFPGSTDALDARIWTELSAALHPKYELIRPLGQGGMGTVVLAREPALERVVAIKVLAPALAADPVFRKRFQTEGRAAAAISHPNVVQVYTVGETSGKQPIPFLILQFVEGAPLDQWLAQNGPVSELRARRLLRDVAAGLAAAHDRALVHLDVKPGNVLVERHTGRAMLVDFGLAAAVTARTTTSPGHVAQDDGHRLGTALYMSPEQYAGDPLGPPSDVFSFGLLAVELLVELPARGFVGPAAPFGRSAAGIAAVAARPGLAADLGRLLQRCLDPDPEGRPAAAEIARAVLPSGDDGVAWPPPGLGDLGRRGRSFRRAAAIATAGTSLLAIATAARLPGTHTAHGWWRAWGDGGLVVSDASGPSTAVVAGWHLALLLGTAAAMIGLALAAIRGVALARALSSARRLGWQYLTLAEVMADPDGRSGQALSGAGDFATVSSVDRRRVRLGRLGGYVAPLVGFLWVAGWLGWWTIGVFLGSVPAPAGGPLLDATGVAVLVVVPFAALVAARFAAAIERRSMGSSPWRRVHTGAFPVSSTAREEDVAGWYRDLEIDIPPAAAVVGDAATRSPAEPRLFQRAMPGLAMLFAAGVIVMMLALGATVAATVIPSRNARGLGRLTARAVAVPGREAPSGGADTGAYRLSGPVPEPALVDSLLSDRLPAFPVDPRLALGGSDVTVARKTLIADAMRRARQLSGDSIARLAGFAEHPRTRAIRRLAIDPPERPLAGPSLGSVRGALEANAAVAVAELARGRVDSARRRLVENHRVARWLVADSARIAAEAGLFAVETTALLPLAELERGAGRVEAAAEAAAGARNAAEQAARYGSGWTIGITALAADPRRTTEFEAALADGRVPLGYRVAVIEGFAAVLCLRPRYLLLGEVTEPAAVRGSIAAEARQRSWWQRLQTCGNMGG